jgi:hypothetical protein
MGFINKNQLKSVGVELQKAVFGDDTLQAGHSNVGSAGSRELAELELDGLVRVRVGAMPGGLLDEFSAVGEDKGLGCRL